MICGLRGRVLGWPWLVGEPFFLAAMVIPKRKAERDDKKNQGEHAPGQLAGGDLGANFEAAALGFVRGMGASAITADGFDLDRRTVAGGFQVVGDSLVFINAEGAGVGADKSLVENAAGELAEFFLLQGLEHAGADLGGGGNLLERDFALFAFELEFFAEGRQVASRWEFYSG